ncbi:Long-chain base-1-phosphate phosphatase [Coemansia sp. RSA 2703]|nr:Long-chain base-1-phosphate phosphatase [Coemansia sp. RSA 2703]KAJ2368680.1 Long-chain base-1-phosphate phosphatase [Coemansia sp. RSA 2607]KAJ2390332.1 Long-chain base-1-phosphate phosphatase [Coemansia sp. RSA 2603]
MPPRFQLDEDDDPTHEAAMFVKAPEEAYAAVYSPFRQRLRQLVMQEVEREMPALISIQQQYRSPLLDHLFVLTGMLGNHAFFMLALPFLHVFGGGMFSRGLTFVVLWSIYFSGWVKDYISAPRPASPPIVHITRSPAHTFEYGFPSSHTTYVVATIIYITHFMLNEWGTPLNGVLAFWTVGCFIVVGRIYCGLHSFIDVIGGGVIGVIEAFTMIAFYPQFDTLLLTTPGPLYLMTILYVALTNIPRSLDLCPCCVDSYCATSVTLGLAIGTWIHSRLPFLWHNGFADKIAWDSSLTILQNTLRCSIALVLVVTWKLASKRPMIALVRRFLPQTSFSNDAMQSEKLSSDIVDSQKAGNYRIPAPGSVSAGHYGTHELMVTCENIARIPIYSGIGVMVYVVAPILFSIFGLMPV